MPNRINAYGQPIGAALPDWKPRRKPGRVVLRGRYCRLEPVDVERHAAGLYAAYAAAPDDSDWTYMQVGPYPDLDSYRAFLRQAMESEDPLHFAIVELESGQPLGTAALLRAAPAQGSLEIGHIAFSRALMRSRAATEAIYLLLQYAFDTLGYRRCEWKCDQLNARSRAAALRFGFSFEGIFRQALVYKGRNRDTAWFSLLDSEWRAVSRGFAAWLAPDNFEPDRCQRERLAELIERARHQY